MVVIFVNFCMLWLSSYKLLNNAHKSKSDKYIFYVKLESGIRSWF